MKNSWNPKYWFIYFKFNFRKYCKPTTFIYYCSYNAAGLKLHSENQKTKDMGQWFSNINFFFKECNFNSHSNVNACIRFFNMQKFVNYGNIINKIDSSLKQSPVTQVNT